MSIERLPKLRVLICNDNRLKSLKIINCPEISTLQCGSNLLTEIDLSQLAVNKLETLDLSANNLTSRDLSCFSRFKNLKYLNLQATDRSKETYNRFHGSLEHLKNLTKLGFLCINDTDIDSGLEQLPKNLQYIVCSSIFRSEANCKSIRTRLDLCHECRMYSQGAPLFGNLEIFYHYQVWSKWKEGDEGNYNRLKELKNILFPKNDVFDFEKLKEETRRLKLIDLNSQLAIKKDESKKLTNSLKNKLDEDGQEWLETLYEAQQEKTPSSFVQKQIEKAKKMIIKKLSENELQKFLDKQKEVNQLEKQIIDLKSVENKLETKIEIPPKK